MTRAPDVSVDQTVRVLGISGSLRERSTNTAVIRTARLVAPHGVAIVVYEGVGGLPHFNPDDDAAPFPSAVAALRGAVQAADALLLSTPEYAGALPGSFKNVLDWLIGDGEAGSIYEKPVAWINASPRGATEAHASLRIVLGFAHADIVESACRSIAVTPPMVGPDGVLADPTARRLIGDALTALVAHGFRRRDRT